MVSLFLVEDERIPRESIKNNVQWKEHHIAFLGDASDGEIALPQILEKKPDILLTDIKMPFMDGLELSQIVRAKLPDTKIIILSGYNEFDYARQAISLGISEYLLKPVSAADILEAVDKVRGQIEATRAARRAREDQVDVQREIFFSSLFSGAISGTGQILRRAEQLSISLAASAYRVVLARFGPITQRDPAFHQALYEAPDLLASGYNGEQITYLLRGEDRDSIRQKTDALSTWVRTIEETYHVQMELFFGKIVFRLSDLCDSYQTANLFRRDQERRPEDSLLVDSASFDSDALLEFLRTGSVSSVRSFWEHYRPVIEQTFPSLIYRCYLYAELFFVVSQYAKESGVTVPAALAEGEALQNRIGTDGSVDDFLDLSCEVCRQVMAERDQLGVGRYSSATDLAREYITQHYMEADLSLSSVAKAVALSPNHLSTIFKTKIGIGFNDYLTEVRIRQAKRLLITTDMRTAEVGERVGYLNMNYFSMLFKKVTGMTPSQYRRERTS